MLPPEVMATVSAQLCDWHHPGVSVMEISHRSPEFMSIVDESEQTLRRLLSIPDNYHVLFLQGGAQLQFAGIPLNLLGSHACADYVVTGQWSRLAAKEAQRYTTVNTLYDDVDQRYRALPDLSLDDTTLDAAYLYYCDNETVHGVEFHEPPSAHAPLIADMSSNLLTKPVDVSRFGVIYACAQKNLGPAGVTVLIIREDLLGREAHALTPTVMNYRDELARQSMINTPVTFSWYVMNEVFKWVEQRGGVSAMAQAAQARSSHLYDYIDQSGFYRCPVDASYRSRINVVFDLVESQHTAAFLEAALQHQLLYLKGHKQRGGCRASLYNAMPMAGVEALVDFMRDFETSA